MLLACCNSLFYYFLLIPVIMRTFSRVLIGTIFVFSCLTLWTYFPRKIESSVRIEYLSHVSEFLHSIYELKPNIMPFVIDRNLTKCLKNVIYCPPLKTQRQIRFALLGKDFRLLIREHDWESNKSTTLFYEMDSTMFLISKIENRYDYWYIPQTQHVFNHAMAFLTPHIESVLIGDQIAYIDKDIDMFLKQLERSQFIECRKDLATKIKGQYERKYEYPEIPDSFLDMLAALRNLFYQEGVYPFLNGGTLLGWYRECGILAHTTDVDMIFHSTELSKHFESALHSLRKPPCQLVATFGFFNDSYQIQLFCHGGVRVDVEPVYQQTNCIGLNGSSCDWMGGTRNIEKYRYYYPYRIHSDVCTGDLGGYLFFVPCQVEPILEVTYGQNWKNVEKKYIWNKSPKNIKRAENWKKPF